MASAPPGVGAQSHPGTPDAAQPPRVGSGAQSRGSDGDMNLSPLAPQSLSKSDALLGWGIAAAPATAGSFPAPAYASPQTANWARPGHDQPLQGCRPCHGHRPACSLRYRWMARLRRGRRALDAELQFTRARADADVAAVRAQAETWTRTRGVRRCCTRSHCSATLRTMRPPMQTCVPCAPRLRPRRARCEVLRARRNGDARRNPARDRADAGRRFG